MTLLVLRVMELDPTARDTGGGELVESATRGN